MQLSLRSKRFYINTEMSVDCGGMGVSWGGEVRYGRSTIKLVALLCKREYVQSTFRTRRKLESTYCTDWVNTVGLNRTMNKVGWNRKMQDGHSWCHDIAVVKIGNSVLSIGKRLVSGIKF